MLSSRDSVGIGVGIDSREAALRCGRKSQLVALIGSSSCKRLCDLQWESRAVDEMGTSYVGGEPWEKR